MVRKLGNKFDKSTLRLRMNKRSSTLNKSIENAKKPAKTLHIYPSVGSEYKMLKLFANGVLSQRQHQKIRIVVS